MKYTNKLNLPQPIYDAIVNNQYVPSGADYSVTGLIKPPQMVKLARQYDNEIEVDITDRIFSLRGQLMHQLLEKNGSGLIEQQFISEFNGKTVSGKIDRYIDNTVQDWKEVSIYEVINDIKFEKIAQVNMYAELMRLNGYKVDKIQLVYFFRDWKKREARYKSGYPKYQAHVQDIDVWESKKVVEYIYERILAHQENKECSAEDRWEKAEVWAVKKKTNIKSTKNHKVKEEAEKHLEQLGDKYIIEYRPMELVRCDDYCDVSDFCQQYKKLKEFVNANKVN